MSEPRLITALINSIFHWSLDSLYLSLCAFSHSSSLFQLPVALSVLLDGFAEERFTFSHPDHRLVWAWMCRGLWD